METLRKTICLMALCSAGEGVIIIETVPVCNPGNTPDTRYATPGYGAVDYCFRIGTYEVTAGQYAAFLNAVAGVDTYSLYHFYMPGQGISRSGAGTLSKPYMYTVDQAYANRPVGLLSWGDAARFVNWLHNGQPTGVQGPDTTETGAYTLNGAMTNTALMAVYRNPDWKWAIPSEDEWYKAAYYNHAASSYYDYPTGSNNKPGRDLEDVSGNNANYYSPEAYPIQPPYYTTVVGQFHNSPSPYGTFDQGGNFWEWNEAVEGTTHRGVRGASYSSVNGWPWMRASHRWAYEAAWQEGDIGLRVLARCPASDLSGDCWVNMEDFAVLAAYWLADECAEPDWCGGADIDASGAVGLEDAVSLALQWLTETEGDR